MHRRRPGDLIGRAAPDIELEGLDVQQPATALSTLLSRSLPTFLVFYNDC